MNARQAAERLPAAPPRPGLAAMHDASWMIAVLAAIMLLHVDTLGSMVRQWLGSQTFAHGLAVVPVSVWLVWRRRADLAGLPHRPAPYALPLLLLCGAAWLLATVASVQVLRQYLVVGMIPLAVVAMYGAAYARAIAFPLGYLLLAVPFGEVLVPPLMDFTARFAVGALRWSGLPVFRDNNFISLDNGNWSVVEACSGLRYVIASLVLGTLYAYLNHRSMWRRLFFIAMALVVPVVANGLRAYLIILLGYWSGMRLAVGVDHLIYGWLFFGLISLLLFWSGSYWRDPPAIPAARPQPRPSSHTPGMARMAAACILVVASAPLLTMLLTADDDSAGGAQPWVLAALPAPWRALPLHESDWQALHAGRPRHYGSRYSDGIHWLILQLTWYGHQRRGAELLTPVWRATTPGVPTWREIASQLRTVDIGGRHITVQQVTLQADSSKLLLWRWYRQADVDTARPVLLKLRLARAKLLHGREDGAEIALAAPYDDSVENAAMVLRQFLTSALPAIDRELRHVAAP